MMSLRSPQNASPEALIQLAETNLALMVENRHLRVALESARHILQTLSIKGFHETPEFIAEQAAEQARIALEAK